MSLLFEGNKLIGFFHYFGETKLIIIIILILLAYLWKIRNYRGMLFAVLTIAFGNGVNQLVKELIGRPRPEIANQLTSFSFPSGHAMVGLLYLFTLAYLVNEVLTDYT
ncbi:MAG: phosphatase PAP2 family protein, partial [Lysinibacillus sp.]|nr:phosphatase PAP2 family protein [Lysinibacillus sp.]